MGAYKDSLADGKNSLRRSNGGHQLSHTPGGRYGNRLPARREEAAKRAEARAARSPQEQIALLDETLGKGVGAVRERARLLKQIENAES